MGLESITYTYNIFQINIFFFYIFFDFFEYIKNTKYVKKEKKGMGIL